MVTALRTALHARSRFLLVLIVGLALALTGLNPAAMAAPVPLTNGGFEAGNNPPTGWTVSGTTGIDVVPGSGWQSSEGSYSIDLNGFHPGTISQSFATYIGGVYTVTFALAGNPGYGGTVTLNASATGAPAVPFSFNTAGRSETSMGWTSQSFTFTATAATTTLTFASTTTTQGSCANGPAACGPALDNIQVSYTPQPPVLTAGGSVTAIGGGAAVVIASTATVTDLENDSLSGATVAIGTNFNAAQDRLGISGQGGTSGTVSGLSWSYNTSTGVLTLSGSASPATYQAALRQVTYSNIVTNATTAPRTVTFSIATQLAFPGTGHFYEFVPNVGIPWTTALSDAATRNLYGLQGYLATITSGSENAFIFTKLQGNGWIGASDQTTEGTWRWVAGPEAGALLNSGYTNWNSGEPNNAGNEDYAHMIGNPNIGVSGQGVWNDLPNNVPPPNDYSPLGYVVEYGGMSGDPTTLQLTANVTVNVLPGNQPPTVSANSASISTNEGTNATNSGSWGDPQAGDNVILSVTAGPGTVTKDGTNSNGTWSWSNPAPDGVTPAAAYNVTITANDGNGGTATTSFSVTVNNVAPQMTSLVATPNTLNESGSTTLTGSFTDSGSADTHSVAITWGDSNTSTLNLAAGILTFSTTHAYADNAPANGPYAVTVTVTDKDGASSAGGDGRIVVNHDEWTLGEPGFNAIPGAAGVFAKNIATWFTGGTPSNFLVYSNNFGLTGPQLAATMTGLGHTWNVNTSLPFTLATLQQYNAVFLSAWPVAGSPDQQTLIAYVNGGGNVYVEGGTGCCGGPVGEAAIWNTFLGAFGLQFASPYNGICCVTNVSSTHVLASGLTQLYFNNGNSVFLTGNAPPQAQVIAFVGSQGILGVYGSQSTVSVYVNNVPPTATLNAPASVTEGDTFTVSLTGGSDVPADQPTLQYAFDCGSGYGAFGPSNQTTCAANDATLSPVTVKGKVKDKDNGVTEYTASVVVTVPTAPLFSQPGAPYPADACICTPLMMNTNVTGAEQWWVKATGISITLDVTAQSVNPTFGLTVEARIYDPSGPQIGTPVVASFPAATPPGTSATTSRTFATVPGAVYRVKITTPGADFSQPHYALKFNGASQAAIKSPSFASLEHQEPVRWFFNVNGSESLSVRWFSTGAPAGATGTHTVDLAIVDPNGSTVATPTLTGSIPPGLDQTITQAGPAGQWAYIVRENEVNGGPGAHYRLQTVGLADAAIYLTPATYGYGSITGTILSSSGAPFNAPVTVNLTAPNGNVTTLTTGTGSFNLPNLFVGKYTVDIVVPPGANPLGPTSFTFFVSCDHQSLVTFKLNRTPKANAGPDQTQPEGSTVALTGAASSDADGNPLSYNWVLLPGFTGPAVTLSGANTVSPTFGTVDNGQYTFELTVDDAFGGVSKDQVVVTITNVNPAVTVTGAAILENGTATITVVITDPGTADTFTVDIDWGAGETASITLPAIAGSQTFSHQYLDDNPTATPSDIYTVKVTAKDDDGGTGSGPSTVKVDNVAPTITATLSAATINENDSVTVSGTITDPGTLDPHTVVIGWGGSEGSTTLTLAPGVLTYSATHQYLDDNPTATPSDVYAIAVKVTDDDTGAGSAAASLTVKNVAPTITVALSAATINENGSVTASGSITDPGTLDPHTVVIGWGGSEGSTTLTLAAGVLTYSATHQYLDDNPTATPSDVYAITVNVTDDDTGAGSAAASLTVMNVAPTVVALTAQTLPLGTPVTVSTTFTDPGTLDTWTYSIDWGDATPAQTGSANPATAVAGTHQYLVPGNRTITLCVSDDDTGKTCVTAAITFVGSPGKITAGVLRFGNNGRGGFNVQSADGVAVKGEFEYHNGSANLHAHTLTMVYVTPDLKKGWFAGTLTDGRVFLAYVEDNGEPGKDDVFKLWVEGVLQNGDGKLTGGNVQIHKS